MNSSVCAGKNLNNKMVTFGTDGRLHLNKKKYNDTSVPSYKHFTT